VKTVEITEASLAEYGRKTLGQVREEIAIRATALRISRIKRPDTEVTKTCAHAVVRMGASFNGLPCPEGQSSVVIVSRHHAQPARS